jgi:hypothetical protein
MTEIHKHTSPHQGGIIEGRDIGTRVFNAWATKAIDTIYQAEEDGFVVAFLNCDTDGDRGYLEGMTDSSATPTTVRVAASGHYYTAGNTYVQFNSVTMPVRKDDYWKVLKTETSGTLGTAVFWLPLSA